MHCAHSTENRGVWSVSEHERFIKAMALYPCGPWQLITDLVGSRSIKQVQTHAQKYQQKLMRHQRGLRKTKTKRKRPEHRVDATTLELFAGHSCIVRYAQRLMKEIEEGPVEEEEPASPQDDSPIALPLNQAQADQDCSALVRGSLDLELLDMMFDSLSGQRTELTQAVTEEVDRNQDVTAAGGICEDYRDGFTDIVDLYEPPKDWKEWLLEDLLPAAETMVLSTQFELPVESYLLNC